MVARRLNTDFAQQRRQDDVDDYDDAPSILLTRVHHSTKEKLLVVCRITEESSGLVVGWTNTRRRGSASRLVQVRERLRATSPPHMHFGKYLHALDSRVDYIPKGLCKINSVDYQY